MQVVLTNFHFFKLPDIIYFNVHFYYRIATALFPIHQLFHISLKKIPLRRRSFFLNQFQTTVNADILFALCKLLH